MFGKGYRPSPMHKLGLGHPEHLLAAATIPTRAEVVMPPPVDQGAVAIQVAMAHSANLTTGKFLSLPSRLFLYFHARAVLGEIMADDGAILTDIFESAAKLGVPPESAWSFSEEMSKITAQPDWAAYTFAADQKIVKGAWRITSTGSRRVDDIKRAIAGDDTVVWGTQLDLAFEDLVAGQVWPGVRGQVVGGHAMVLHKYDGDVFWTRSSWGQWCEGGSARVSADAVASIHAADFWIVETVEPFAEVV